MPGGWERLASHEGGTVVDLVTAPTDSGTTLFAATVAGLFRSDDAGRGWTAAGDTPLPLLAAVAPSARFAENGLLFAGTQTGFHRSTDAGRTWRQTLSGGRVFAISVVPGGDAEELLFIGTDEDGILRSDDGGRTWAGANPGLLDLTILALAFSPDAARDQTGFAATATGLYRTRNGGKSWRAVELPLDEPAVQCVAISPTFADDRLVLAGTEGEGLWRSDDGGNRWDLVPGLPTGRIDAIAFSSGDADARLIAVATAEGVALSCDGGATWSLTGAALPPVLALTFVAEGDGETLVAGLYRDGVVRLVIGEEDHRWVPANTGLGATFLSTLVASPSFHIDRTLIAAGPDAGLRLSRDGGRTWADAGLTDTAVYGAAFVPEAGGGHAIVTATETGIYRSRAGGADWAGPLPGGESPADIIVASAAADDGRACILAATLDSHLLASDDGGDGWHSLDTSFDGATVISLACAPDGTCFAGTMQSGAGRVILWRSTDGGKRWDRWLEERNDDGTLPLAMPSGGDVLFVGLGGRVVQPRRNAWQTRGGARSPLWSGVALTTDAGEPVAITALAASPSYHADGMVFAATSAGIYRSRDRGRTFDRWSEGLAPTPILALAVTVGGDDTLVLFAHSVDGTIWRRAGDA